MKNISTVLEKTIQFRDLKINTKFLVEEYEISENLTLIHKTISIIFIT